MTTILEELEDMVECPACNGYGESRSGVTCPVCKNSEYPGKVKKDRRKAYLYERRSRRTKLLITLAEGQGPNPTARALTRAQRSYIQGILNADPDAELMGWHKGRPIVFAYVGTAYGGKRESYEARQAWIVGKQGQPVDLPRNTWQDNATLIDSECFRFVEGALARMVTT